MPEFWQLRTIDGYYGLGVPRRLRALPWPTGLSLRTISFTNLNDMPWELLGLLNVRAVLVAGDGVFRNIVRDGRTVREADPAQFQIIPSPARVTPRAFFVAQVAPVSSPEEAASRLFQRDGIIDPQKVSFAEGWDKAQAFDPQGDVRLQSGADVIEVRFDARQNPRFLVVNELFYPGWHAEIAGREVPILATNAVMRGIVIPAGADQVRLRYASIPTAPSAWLYRGLAVLTLLGVFLLVRVRTS